MSTEFEVPCELCGATLPHSPSWFNWCPELDRAHAVCILCAVEWELAELRLGKDQMLKACPDTVRLARRLMERPEPLKFFGALYFPWIEETDPWA